MLRKFFLYILPIGLFLTGCRIYHNTAARFNAYFLAKERMLQVEDALFGNPNDDYNDVLQVLVKLDTSVGKSQKGNLDYIIEKATLPIEFHEESKWVDDAWLLVGKARLYQGDFANALQTFRFVNTSSPDPDARHASQVLLMRTFVEEGDDRNVAYVDEYIRKDTIPFADENAFDYHLVRAHFYRQKYDLEMVAQHLEVALPVAKKNEQRARINFILGQIYERLDKTDLAYQKYKRVFKNNPDFDLAFYADVNSFGLQNFKTEEEVADAYKYYEKLLNEESNWNLRDKIYYEMGQFEERRGNYDSALVHYNNAITYSKDNLTQRAYTYLNLGRIFYDEKYQYVRAASYYDSAFQIMPKETRIYEETEERNDALKDFVKYFNEIKRQDNLQLLSKLDSAEQTQTLLEEIEAEKQAILEKAKNDAAREQIRNQMEPPSSSPLAKKGEPTWYFYNIDAVATGKVEFLKVWGNRPLEDDWRRSDKPFTGNISIKDDKIGKDSKDDKKAEKTEEDLFANVKSLEERLNEIPKTKEDLAKSNAILEEMLFELGKLYYFELKEYNNAVETLERFTFDFPKNKNVPEAYYLMYNICQTYDKCIPSVYKAKLIDGYPNSLYARLLENPDFFKENKLIDEKAGEEYAKAFEAYRGGQFDNAETTLKNIKKYYPTTTIMDKVALLQAMIIGRKSEEDKTAYYSALQKFLVDYKGSKLTGFAKDLLNAIPEEGLKGGG